MKYLNKLQLSRKNMPARARISKKRRLTQPVRFRCLPVFNLHKLTSPILPSFLLAKRERICEIEDQISAAHQSTEENKKYGKYCVMLLLVF